MTTPEPTPVLRAEGLSRTYRRGAETLRALDHASFSVAHGEYLAVIGPSGAGKTTLLNLIGCMDTPTSGRLEIEGREVSTLGEGERTRLRRNRLGFVFQHFGLIATLTVEENVSLPLLFSRRSDSAWVSTLLGKVGLDQRRGHRPHQLSGGEMQRVAIARALVSRPAFLLADEPTGNLDSASGDSVIRLFQQLNREGLTVIVVTHNPALAAAASRRLHLRDGRLEPAS